MKKKKKLLSKAFIGLVIMIAVCYFYVNYTVFTPISETDSKEISIVIKKGSKIDDISTTLEKAGLIRSKFTFYAYTRILGFDKNIIAGRFILNKTMNVPAILTKITSEAPSEQVLIVQEGLTVNDIDAKLVDLDLILPGEFIQATRDFNNYEKYSFLNKEKMNPLEAPLEGYLYPDTYYIDPVEFNSQNLIQMMLDNFNKKLKSIGTIPSEQQKSITDVIIMASILQREVRTPDDYSLVSGILWKRLDSNWHIGADATILYATKKKTVEADDLDIESPYNTRLHTGMPPGPICNPDIEHIKAAFQPAESEYWYYLTTLDTGDVIYAKTNDEQNINKAKYL
jgi:UPF0755 protein